MSSARPNRCRQNPEGRPTPERIPKTARWALMAAGLVVAACAPVRPPSQDLAGPLPEGPNDRAMARFLSLVRSELGDLLVLAPVPGREAVLPDLSPTARTQALLRIQNLRGGLQRFETVSLSKPWRAQLAYAFVLLDRAEGDWGPPEGDSPRILHPRGIDRGLRRAMRFGATVDPFLRAAALEVRLCEERERTWALDRLQTYAARFGGEALQAYRSALAKTPTRAASSLAPALRRAAGATVSPDLPKLRQNARLAFERARQRLYELAVLVAPDGPRNADLRVEMALPLARGNDAPNKAGPAELLRSDLEHLRKWIDEAEAWPAEPAPVLEVHLVGDRLPAIRVRTATRAEVVEGLSVDDLGANPRRTLLAKALAGALFRTAQPSRTVFPGDAVAVKASTTAFLERLADSRPSPPSLRLLAASFVAERRARAAAELIAEVDGVEAARNLLVERAFYDISLAEDVLRTARAEPGVFAGPYVAGVLGARGESGLPAGVRRRVERGFEEDR